MSTLDVSVLAWYNFGGAGGGAVGVTVYSEKQCYLKALALERGFVDAWARLACVGGGEVDDGVAGKEGAAAAAALRDRISP